MTYDEHRTALKAIRAEMRATVDPLRLAALRDAQKAHKAALTEMTRPVSLWPNCLDVPGE